MSTIASSSRGSPRRPAPAGRLLALALIGLGLPHGVLGADCPVTGEWWSPATGDSPGHAAVIERLAERDVVLLGERHAVAGVQRWQLHTVAALHGRRTDMVLAFEAFPRSVQPALDAWVRGELDEAAFLEQSRWDEVWGFGTEHYRPLFWFARMHRVPMVAMNVERSLVSRVGSEGWHAIPPSEREGLGDPAPATSAYRSMLRAVLESKYAHPPGAQAGEQAPGHGGEAASDRGPSESDLDRFVQAQLTWDRAFAEAISKALEREPRPLVAVIVGRGHAEHGYGVPHQLSDLGVDDVAVALTHAAGEPCEALAPDGAGAAVADVVFGLEAEPPRRAGDGPRLGVMIETAGEGDDAAVRVGSVVEGSVAEATGVRPGDLIVEAAGVRTRASRDLVAIIRRQAPGTWLPLTVRREGTEMELIAKFPVAP